MSHRFIKTGVIKKSNVSTTFNELEKHLLNDFQHRLPLSTTPYADMADRLGVNEHDVLHALSKLQDEGVISRVGPVFAPNRVGVSTLAAMAVPEHDLECVARIISAFPEVNHNYEREHAFNLWFVVTATSQQHLQQVLDDIESITGYPLMALPMLEDYFIDLGFKIVWD
jgi:DNA-binding Lrp family transcriptional regulator